MDVCAVSSSHCCWCCFFFISHHRTSPLVHSCCPSLSQIFPQLLAMLSIAASPFRRFFHALVDVTFLCVVGVVPPHPTLLLIWCVCVCRCVAWRGDLCLSPCSLVDSAAFRSLFEMCMHWPVSWLACMTTSRRAVSGHVYACVHQRLYRGMQDRCLRCFCCLLMPSISSTLSFLSLFPSLAPTLMWALSLGEFSRSGDVTSPVRAA